MGENTKFSLEEIDLENLLDHELPLTGQDSTASNTPQESSMEKSNESSEIINAKSIENLNPIELEAAVENSEPIALAEVVEESEPIALAEAVEESEPIALVEAAEESKPIALAEAVEESKPIALVEAVEEPEPVKIVEAVEEPEPVKIVEAVEEPEPVKIVEAIEEPEPVEFKEPAKEITSEKTNKTQLHTTITTPAEELNIPAFPSTANANSSLQTAEYLSIAQDKILELHKTIETLHEENANVTAAGELWKQRSNKSEQALIDLKNKHDNIKHSKETEQKIFTMTIDKQNKKMEHLKNNLDEADLLTEEKLNTYKLISSDLENRIEIIEREKLALLEGKNKFISDLQRQINILQKINTNDKKKLQKVSVLINEKEKTLRNTIKLLRQTLISLEIGDTESPELSLAS